MRSADKGYFLSPSKADGKRYFVQEWNPTQKTVVVFIHGFPGSSDHAKLMTSSTLHESFRLIAIDRPGYGQSDFQKDITPMEFAAQICEILDEMKIEKVRLLSVSGGAPYCMALAHQLQDRVVKMCSISGVAPLSFKNFRYLNSQQKKTFALHVCLPFTLQKKILDRVWKNGFDKLDEFVFTKSDEATGPDKDVFTHPDFSPILMDTLEKALVQGPAGILQDIRVYTKPWGFKTHEIPCPITLWHGLADDIVNIAYAREMKAMLKNADLREVSNEGHYSIAMNFRDQILSDLLT